MGYHHKILRKNKLQISDKKRSRDRNNCSASLQINSLINFLCNYVSYNCRLSGVFLNTFLEFSAVHVFLSLILNRHLVNN